MEKYKYLFIQMFEDGVTTQLTDKLDDFRDFCHYCDLSDWNEHKKLIKKCLRKSCQYEFTGNDVWYYILTHPVWEIIPRAELTIKVKGDN